MRGSGDGPQEDSVVSGCSEARPQWLVEIQDASLRCNCCCMDAYWDGRAFVRFGRHVVLNVREEFRNVTRWRGLTERARDNGEQNG